MSLHLFVGEVSSLTSNDVKNWLEEREGEGPKNKWTAVMDTIVP